MNLEEARREAAEQFRQLTESIVAVQPMDPTVIKNLMSVGRPTEQLIREGYVPVSSLGLMWIKQEDNK